MDVLISPGAVAASPSVAPRTARWLVAPVLFAVATVALLAGIVGHDAILAALRAFDGRVIAATVVLELFALGSLAQVYRSTFRVSGGWIPYREGLTVALGVFSLTQLLPGGGVAGGVFAARRLSRGGAGPVAAAATVVLVGLVMFGTLGALVSIVTAISAIGSGEDTAYAIVSTSATAVIATALLVLRAALGRDAWRARLVAVLEQARWRGRAPLAAFAHGLDAHRLLLQRPGVLLRPAAWAVLNWSIHVTVLWLLVTAAGGSAPLVAIMAGYGAAHLLNGLPLTPGGIGLVEVGMAGTLVAFGTDPAAASIAAIGYRLVAYWLPVAIALPTVGSQLRRPAMR